MATNNQYMAQKIIRRMGDDTTERYYLNSAFHAGLGRGNGMAFKGLVRKGFVALADVGLGYVLTPAGQQEYARLFSVAPQPVTAPASEPQTEDVSADTVSAMLNFIADRPRPADVFQPSGLAILDGLVAEGKATLVNGYYEVASPPATSEPQAVTPADEAALGVSMSELDAALTEANQPTSSGYQSYLLDCRDQGVQNPLRYSEWLEFKVMALSGEVITLKTELDAANAKLAAIRQHDLDAIGTLVYGETDEQAVYQERSGRPDADDDLLTIEEVRDYLDIEGGHHGD